MNQLTQEGVAALKAGDKERAQKLFVAALEEDNDDLQAWLWLSGAVESDVDRLECLEQVLRIDPLHALASKGAAQLRARGVKPAEPVKTPPEEAFRDGFETHEPEADEHPFGDLEETSLRIRNGWYDTGDIGIIDEDGFLWHKGRLKRFVKVGGEMVSLVKVEALLSELLPENVICCVVDVPNPTKGADVVAAVANGDFDQHKVLKALKKVLPSIAVPRQFYVIEDIPMMASGKVNFREVEKICREKNARNES